MLLVGQRSVIMTLATVPAAICIVQNVRPTQSHHWTTCNAWAPYLTNISTPPTMDLDVCRSNNLMINRVWKHKLTWWPPPVSTEINVPECTNTIVRTFWHSSVLKCEKYSNIWMNSYIVTHMFEIYLMPSNQWIAVIDNLSGSLPDCEKYWIYFTFVVIY